MPTATKNVAERPSNARTKLFDEIISAIAGGTINLVTCSKNCRRKNC